MVMSIISLPSPEHDDRCKGQVMIASRLKVRAKKANKKMPEAEPILDRMARQVQKNGQS